jgi:hypothetical protein
MLTRRYPGLRGLRARRQLPMLNMDARVKFALTHEKNT